MFKSKAELLSCLIAGYKVRCKDWEDDQYIFYCEKRDKFIDENNVEFFLQRWDIVNAKSYGFFDGNKKVLKKRTMKSRTNNL